MLAAALRKFFGSSNGRILFSLNIAAILFYFIFLNSVGYLGHIDEMVLSTNDSKEYYGYTDFLTGRSGYCNPNRPFLYPLLLFFSTGMGGLKGIWFMQLVAWLVACNLSYISVIKLNGGKFFATVAFMLPATYFSAICLTAHALTEVIILLLLSILTYWFSVQFGNYRSLRFALISLLLLALLFAAKPFFLLPMLLCLFITLVFHFRTCIKRPVTLVWLVLCFSPAIIQFSINKTQHGVLNSDRLIDINIRLYLTNKVDYYAQHNDLEKFNYLGDSTYAVRAKRLKRMSMGQIKSFLLRNWKSTLVVMYDNLQLNIATPHPYISSQYPFWISRSYHVNKIFFSLHLYMFFLFTLYAVALLFMKKQPFHFYFLALGFILFMMIAANSITFWAGDRLVVACMGIWCVLYPLFMREIFYRLFSSPKAMFHKAWLWSVSKMPVSARS